MLHNGADPNVADNLGQTPLFVAIGPGYVQSLLHAGARTDVVDQNGNTPLIVNLLGLNTALYNGTLYDNVFARVEDWKATTSAILHSPKPNINQTNKVGDTALTYTESHDQLHYLVRPLIALGANVKVKDNDGKSILWFLKFPGDQAIAKYAVSHGVSVIDTDNSGTPLLNAIVSRGDYQYGDYAYVLFLLAHGAQVNREDNHGTRPLDIATKQANGQMIDLIKQHGGKTD